MRVRWLSEHGHVSAQEALRCYATAILEDGKSDLPTSIRGYLSGLLNGRLPSHPEGTRTDIVKRMLHNAGIAGDRYDASCKSTAEASETAG
jgi:hypothetical protein